MRLRNPYRLFIANKVLQEKVKDDLAKIKALEERLESRFATVHLCTRDEMVFIERESDLLLREYTWVIVAPECVGITRWNAGMVIRIAAQVRLDAQRYLNDIK